MKGIPKRKGLLVVALIFALIFTSGLTAGGTSFAADPPPAESGEDVGLGKVAVNDGLNEWEVTLTVNGNQKDKATNVIIVMDRSRSMSYKDSTNKTRIDRAKIAVNELAAQVMKADSRAKIAVITFDRTATKVQEFTSVSAILTKSINKINANYYGKPKSAGGTNLQAGLHKTAELMTDPNAKYTIVLVGDGAPTHSFQFDGSVDAALESCPSDSSPHEPDWNILQFNESYDYASIIGYGNKYEITGPALKTEACTADSGIMHEFVYPDNHGIPALYEAEQLDEKEVKIYAIGIGVADDGRDILQKCANSGYCDIKTTEPVYDFSGIASAICSQAFQSVVTDPVGEEFFITPAAVEVTRGDASLSNNNSLITWDIGGLKPGEYAEMSYRVKAKPGTIFENGENNVYPDYGIHETNGSTFIKYSYPRGKSLTSLFPIPTVPLTGGAVNLKAIIVNDAGNPVNAAGVETSYENALRIDVDRFPANDQEYAVYGDCQVSMGAIEGYQYRGYHISSVIGEGTESSDPDDLIADVALAPENNCPTVYFKYYRDLGTEPEYADVMVRYVDENGKDIADPDTYEDSKVGSTITIPDKVIPGYEPAGGPAEAWTVIASPTNTYAENTVLIRYKLAAPVDPPGPGPSPGPGGGGGSAAAAAPALNKTDHFAYIVGYPDSEVKPLGSITREEVAVIFYRLMTAESRKNYYSTSQPFTDVSGSRWSGDEIASLYNAKIIQGNSDGRFLPSKPITRAEFAAIAAKFDKLEEVSQNKFPDIESHWAKKYINSSAEKGWISGYGDGTFRPDSIIIRCEAMKLINEVLDRRVNIAGLCSGTHQWPDNEESKWYYEIVLEATNTHDYERANKPKSTEKWTKIKDNPVW